MDAAELQQKRQQLSLLTTEKSELETLISRSTERQAERLTLTDKIKTVNSALEEKREQKAAREKDLARIKTRIQALPAGDSRVSGADLKDLSFLDQVFSAALNL